MTLAAETESTPNSTLHEVLSIIGGRLAYMNKVCRSHDMLRLAKHLLAVEKGWLLSQIGLIEDCDDDVMDEVGSSCFVVLVCNTVSTNLSSSSKNGVHVPGYYFVNS